MPISRGMPENRLSLARKRQVNCSVSNVRPLNCEVALYHKTELRLKQDGRETEIIYANQANEPRNALLEFDRRARFGKLGLDLLGLFLANAFLDRLRRAIHQVFRFFQA